MYSKEKIRELANKVSFDFSIRDKNIEVITEWLEQNQPEPVVVGLTEEQISLLTEVVAGIDNISRIENRITGFLMTQKFEKPEVKEVPVGLTDEQIHSLAYYIGDGDYDNLKWSIGIWQRGQEFPKCDEYERTIRALKKEIEQLKSQQLKPNWEDAPPSATEVTITLNWYRHGTRIKGKHLVREQRPKPTPQVELGQSYSYKGETYVVTGIERIKGKTKIGGEWIEGLELVHYHRGTNLISIEFQAYTRTLSDFLAKFEQVQP